MEPVSAWGASLTISKMRPALQLLVNFKLFSYLAHMCNIRGLLLLD